MGLDMAPSGRHATREAEGATGRGAGGAETRRWARGEKRERRLRDGASKRSETKWAERQNRVGKRGAGRGGEWKGGIRQGAPKLDVARCGGARQSAPEKKQRDNAKLSRAVWAGRGVGGQNKTVAGESEPWAKLATRAMRCEAGQAAEWCGAGQAETGRGKLGQSATVQKGVGRGRDAARRGDGDSDKYKECNAEQNEQRAAGRE